MALRVTPPLVVLPLWRRKEIVGAKSRFIFFLGKNHTEIKFSYAEFDKSLCRTVSVVGFHFVPPKPESLCKLPVSPARLPIRLDFCIAIFLLTYM